jgi:hypothetical protein
MLLLRLLRGLAQNTSEKKTRSWLYIRSISLPEAAAAAAGGQQ